MEVLRDLLNLDSVKEAKGTFGYYDILVKIIAPTDKDIEKIVATMARIPSKSVTKNDSKRGFKY